MIFKPTMILLVGAVIIGAAYDIWAVSHNYHWTISANLLAISARFPVVPFVGGFLIGHVLWPNKGANDP